MILLRALSVVVLLLMPMMSQAATVTLTVVGTPATGPWAVQGTVNTPGTVYADIYTNGVKTLTENVAPYCSFANTTPVCDKKALGNGTYLIEFRFFTSGTTTELGRASVSIVEGASTGTAPAKVGPVTLTIQPATYLAQLTWTASPEVDLAGYRVYVGTKSRSYGNVTPIAKTKTTATVSNLLPAMTYYFAVTAYDNAGNESVFSDEVSKAIP